MRMHTCKDVADRHAFKFGNKMILKWWNQMSFFTVVNKNMRSTYLKFGKVKII